MKTLIASLVLAIFSTQVMAQDTAVIACADDANQLTLIDLTAMVRNKSGFETGSLSIEKQNSESFQNIVLMTKYNEEKNEVTYKATIAGTVTNADNGKSVYTIDQCEVRFVADTCAVKSQVCNGI